MGKRRRLRSCRRRTQGRTTMRMRRTKQRRTRLGRKGWVGCVSATGHGARGKKATRAKGRCEKGNLLRLLLRRRGNACTSLPDRSARACSTYGKGWEWRAWAPRCCSPRSWSGPRFVRSRDCLRRDRRRLRHQRLCLRSQTLRRISCWRCCSHHHRLLCLGHCRRHCRRHPRTHCRHHHRQHCCYCCRRRRRRVWPCMPRPTPESRSLETWRQRSHWSGQSSRPSLCRCLACGPWPRHSGTSCPLQQATRRQKCTSISENR